MIGLLNKKRLAIKSRVERDAQIFSGVFWPLQAVSLTLHSGINTNPKLYFFKFI